MSSQKIIVGYWRYVLLIVLVFVSLGSLLTVDPIRQDVSYHAFADTRLFFGIHNCLDVVSNLPFLIIGILGLRLCFRSELGELSHAWVLFFIGVGLVSVGSAYYHWNPNNESLVWDRLAMTIAFMALFAALLGEYLHQRVGKLLLWPLVLIGLASVVYWHSADDLRMYAWVQFFPLLVIPLLMLMFDSMYTLNRLILLALGWYVLAKIVEFNDSFILEATTGVVSGHTLKHIFAAAGAYSFYLMLSRRKYIGE